MSDGLSVFLEQFGDTPFNRMLEFFIVSPHEDYNITEVAKEAGVAYVTAKSLMPRLIEKSIVVVSRTIGKARMYKAKMDNPKMQAFYKFWIEINIGEMEKERKKLKLLA